VRIWLIAVAATALAACAAILAGLAGAMQEPRIARYVVTPGEWPSGIPTVRIVQLSDMHAATPFMTGDRLATIVEQTNRLKPDIVVLTGDFVADMTLGARPLDPGAAIRPLRNLKARYGVAAVLGNHDHWFNEAGLSAELRRSGIHLLSNAHERIGPVILSGVDDDFTGHDDVKTALDGLGAGAPVILLSHSPDVFPEVPPWVPLTLAGHTHGGQIVLPLLGPLATESRFGRRFVHGLVRENGHDLIVSAGLGTTFLPLRIGVPPEIVKIDVRPRGEKQRKPPPHVGS